MAKPIFIVRYPKVVSIEQALELEKMVNNKLPDYHCFICQSDIDNFKFECFYEKDFDEIKYEELKQIVKSYFKNGDNS